MNIIMPMLIRRKLKQLAEEGCEVEDNWFQGVQSSSPTMIAMQQQPPPHRFCCRGSCGIT